MSIRTSTVLAFIIGIHSFSMGQPMPTSTTSHPRLYVKNEDRQTILEKIENEEWARESWENLLAEIDPHVTRHQSNPEWIVSRLAMYWKEGERYTQCYIKKQNWDYGEGNAPIPTVRLPGMRTWNSYINVPLEDRIPYNESGDMLAIDRAIDDKTPVLVPYKETGHMVRSNNGEILKLAEKASFAYWITKDEKYAKFSADIFWTWLLGTYYMNPPLDPKESTGGPGAYAPGGIMGYYDYEQIHDDHQVNAALTYDFLHDYLSANPNEHLEVIDKDITEVAGIVFKRFIEIGLVRGGKRGNWNVNGFKNIVPSMLILESNKYYGDKKGREYYIPYYTKITTDYHTALPDFIKQFDANTGLWPESPGYASGIISTVLEMGIPLYKSGVNTIADNPLLQKAAMANLGWLDARGNLVLFGDMRGGPTSFSVFERMHSYYTMEGDYENARKMSIVIRKGILANQYDRNEIDWKGICVYEPLPESGNELPFHRAAYSEFHRHLIMKNGNSEEDGLMFTLYGGKKGAHLSANGLAMQFYGKGWALAPDASAYESYWSKDAGYHRGITGSNTIMSGYDRGEITINAMDPIVDVKEGLYNTSETSANCSFVDVSADEKRRVVAMIRTSPTTGYYVDIFRSDQEDNDYVHHNLGNKHVLKNAAKGNLNMEEADLDQYPQLNYSFFKNVRKAQFEDDFWSSWEINSVSPSINIDMWMMGQANREIYQVDAPPTTIRPDVTPGQVNKSPQTTPTLIVRQTNNNAAENPFVAVFEAYNEGEKSIQEISKIETSNNFISLLVQTGESMQYIYNATDEDIYQPQKGTSFKGTMGISSFTGKNLQYLYMGNSKLLKEGIYQIEAVDNAATAELRMENGKYYYTSDQPIRISLAKGKIKTFPAGTNLLVK